MYRLAIILFIALFAGEAFAADTRLDKPVTLAIKGEALSDIMPIIEKQTGVRLRVAHDIADQKATIFVDDKPLKEIMSGLAKLFEYQWSYQEIKGVRSYDLSMSGKVRRARESRRDKAIGQAWKDLDAEMKRVAEMPVKSREELDELFDQTEFDQTVSGDDSLPGMYKVSGYDSDRRKKAVAHLYLTFSPSLRKALRDGMTVCWDLDSPEPDWKIPTALEKEFRDGTVYYAVVPNDPDKRTKKDFGTLTVELSASTTADKFQVEVHEQMGKAPDRMGYVFRAYEKSLLQRAPPTENFLPHEGDDAALDGKLSCTDKELAQEAALPELPPWDTASYVNRSDLLAILHKKLGVQIISDHYSNWYAWIPAENRSARSILDGFGYLPGASVKTLELSKKPGDEQHAMYLAELYPAADWGWDGKLLYMRAANAARMDSREIPNRLLRRWQASTDSGFLGLDDLADVQMLTGEQLKALAQNCRYLGMARGIGSFENNGGLRLYGLLSPTQRRQALEGGLSTQGLTPAQEAAVTKMMARLYGGSTIARRGERVGIYDESGHRVDKPDTGVTSYPVSVEITITHQEECVVQAGEVSGWKSYEDALRAVPGEKERASIRKGIIATYEMVFRKADGMESKAFFDVLRLAPNAPEQK